MAGMFSDRSLSAVLGEFYEMLLHRGARLYRPPLKTGTLHFPYLRYFGTLAGTLHFATFIEQIYMNFPLTGRATSTRLPFVLCIFPTSKFRYSFPHLHFKVFRPIPTLHYEAANTSVWRFGKKDMWISFKVPVLHFRFLFTSIIWKHACLTLETMAPLWESNFPQQSRVKWKCWNSRAVLVTQ